MRERGTYVIIRELHLDVKDGKVKEWCERIVDLLMGEEGEGTRNGSNVEEDGKGRVEELVDEEDSDDEDEVVPIF